MKVKKLIELLQKEDPNRIVVLSSDMEGNNFGELDDVSTGKWDKTNREIGLEKLTKELIGYGYSEEDVMKDGQKAVFLWPNC